MKTITLKAVFQYSLSLLLAVGLFVYVYGNRDLSQLFTTGQNISWEWIGLSLFVANLSHLSRALRWRVALSPLGYRASAGGAYIAVMVGYLANLVVPRMGEFSRCAVFQRSDKVPFTVSFGAVVAERVVDLLFLVLVIFITLLLEFERVGGFITAQFSAQAGALQQKLLIALGLLVVLGVILGAVYRFRERLEQLALFRKGFSFLRGIRDGLLSIRKMPLRLRLQYVLYSFTIWFLYFLMTYVLFPALPATTGLGVSAGFVVLMMGSLGMVMPVQAGIGFYHLFVSVGVASFGVLREDAEDFAFLIHSSQVAGIVIMGGISLLINLFRQRQDSQA